MSPEANDKALRGGPPAEAPPTNAREKESRDRVFDCSYSENEPQVYGLMGAAQALIRLLDARLDDTVGACERVRAKHMATAQTFLPGTAERERQFDLASVASACVVAIHGLAAPDPAALREAWLENTRLADTLRQGPAPRIEDAASPDTRLFAAALRYGAAMHKAGQEEVRRSTYHERAQRLAEEAWSDLAALARSPQGDAAPPDDLSLLRDGVKLMPLDTTERTAWAGCVYAVLHGADVARSPRLDPAPTAPFYCVCGCGRSGWSRDQADCYYARPPEGGE